MKINSHTINFFSDMHGQFYVVCVIPVGIKMHVQKAQNLIGQNNIIVVLCAQLSYQ